MIYYIFKNVLEFIRVNVFSTLVVIEDTGPPSKKRELRSRKPFVKTSTFYLKYFKTLSNGPFEHFSHAQHDC